MFSVTERCGVISKSDVCFCSVIVSACEGGLVNDR